MYVVPAPKLADVTPGVLAKRLRHLYATGGAALLYGSGGWKLSAELGRQ